MTRPNKHIPGILLWIASQAGVLLLGVSRFQLWAHHPFPQESAALAEMLCMQVLLAALFPHLLLATRQLLLLQIATTVWFDELAGLLALAPQQVVIQGFCGVTLWLVGIYTCMRLVGETRQLLVIGMATIWLIGPVLIDYSRHEFSQANNLPTSPTSSSLLTLVCLNSGQYFARLCAVAALPLVLAAPLSLQARHRRKAT